MEFLLRLLFDLLLVGERGALVSWQKVALVVVAEAFDVVFPNFAQDDRLHLVLWLFSDEAE